MEKRIMRRRARDETTRCYGLHEWEAYGEGKGLSVRQMHQMRRHIESCMDCLETVDLLIENRTPYGETEVGNLGFEEIPEVIRVRARRRAYLKAAGGGDLEDVRELLAPADYELIEAGGLFYLRLRRMEPTDRRRIVYAVDEEGTRYPGFFDPSEEAFKFEELPETPRFEKGGYAATVGIPFPRGSPPYAQTTKAVEAACIEIVDRITDDLWVVEVSAEGLNALRELPDIGVSDDVL